MLSTRNIAATIWVVFFASVCTQVLLAEAGPDTVFHVARSGNDTNDGNEVAPFVSIERAQLEIRKLVATGLSCNVRVLIHGGRYELGKPLVFTPQDSGTAKFSITYAAVSNEIVVVSGGQIITGWTKGDDNVWTAEVPEVKDGQWYFRNLTVNGHRATRARSPNVTDPNHWFTIKRFDKITWATTLGAGQVGTWKNLTDVEIIFLGTWTTIRKCLRFADAATATLILQPPYIPMCGYNIEGGSLCYLENARAFLDQPGEWYLDRTTGTLSYWPRPGEDLTTAMVIAPKLTRLLEVRGTARQPVTNLHFKGLRFYDADAPLPPHGYSGASYGLCRLVEYDQNKPATPNANEAAYQAHKRLYRMNEALWLEFSRSCSVEDGELAHLGANALSLDIGCSRCLVQGNRIYDLGDTGIIIGYQRLDVSQLWPRLSEQCHSNQIVNNEFFDCGTTYFEGPAVHIRAGSQTLVAHNYFHDCPSYGTHVGTVEIEADILAPGVADENYFINNEIQNVCQTMVDCGAMLIWGVQTTGNVIQSNVIHDVKGYGAIYFDKKSSGYRVEKNIIYNLKGGSPIHYEGVSPESFILHDNYWQGSNSFVNGKIGHALSFSTDQFVDLPHQAALGSSQMTVEAWVNLYKLPTGADPSAWVLCKNTNELTDGNYSLVVSHNNVGAYLNIGGGRENCYAAWSLAGPLQTGTWHLLALTYDGTNLNVFCDGKLAGTTPVNHRLGVGASTSDVSGRPRSTGTGPLRIGKRGDGYNPSFPGLINEINFYNRALSNTELAGHFSNPPVVPSPSSQLSALNSSLQSTVSSLPSSPIFHWNANDTYTALEQIMSHAGPEEPYRSRFAACRESDEKSSTGSSVLIPPTTRNTSADRPAN